MHSRAATAPGPQQHPFSRSAEHRAFLSWGPRHLGRNALAGVGGGVSGGGGRVPGSSRRLDHLHDPPNGPGVLLREPDQGRCLPRTGGQLGGRRRRDKGRGLQFCLSGSLRGVMSSKTSSDLRGGNRPAGRGHHVEGASDPTPRCHKRKMLFPRLSRRDFSDCCFLTSCSGWGGVGGPREQG